MYAGVDEGSKRSIMQKKLDDMTMMITQCGLVFGVGKSLMFVRHENPSLAHMQLLQESVAAVAAVAPDKNQSLAHMYSGYTPRCTPQSNLGSHTLVKLECTHTEIHWQLLSGVADVCALSRAKRLAALSTIVYWMSESFRCMIARDARDCFEL